MTTFCAKYQKVSHPWKTAQRDTSLSTNTLGSKITVVVSLYLRFLAFDPLP